MSEDSPSENGTEESFADLMESYGDDLDPDVRVGDKIRGQIISIGRDSVFIDTGTKIDGVVDREELVDEEGALDLKTGDSIELYVVATKGDEIRLSKALSGSGAAHALEDAFRQAIPVEGTVKGTCKGGFNIQLMGKRAFCPFSQIDITSVREPDSFIGETLRFLIVQFERESKNIVISRRKLLEADLEEKKAEFFKNLDIGSDLEGRVTKIMPYGAFVEICPGVEGLVHLSELSWSRVAKIEELLKVGVEVTVRVVGIEPGNKPNHSKIALSIKQRTEDPWETVGKHFRSGDKVTGVITRCVRYGAFAEISPGIEGLIHISEMSYEKRVQRPEDFVQPGEKVHVLIKEINAGERRISLSIKDAEGDPWLNLKDRFKSGQTVKGVIEKKQRFGYFINLAPGVTGLLPSSSIETSENALKIQKRKVGEAVMVVVERIDMNERKVTLAIGESITEDDWTAFSEDSQQSFGLMGQKLKQALGSKKKK